MASNSTPPSSSVRSPEVCAGLSWPVVAGQVLTVGFDGFELPDSVTKALRDGERGGVILFRRNLRHSAGHADVSQVKGLIDEICRAGASFGLLPKPLISVDQEGGRVRRLGTPFVQLPPMRALTGLDDGVLERLATLVAGELAAVGFDMTFAPVLDVDSNPDNPVIGDRAFSNDANRVASAGRSFLRGLRAGGLLGCGKHFPGHGDTLEDSHFSLPRVRHRRNRLDTVELAPFRAAIAEGLETVMTAHVLFDALDVNLPATLSSAVVQDLLRGELGFDGCCISDDLLMRGVSPLAEMDPDHVAEMAVKAIAAGCDMLLVCAHPNVASVVHRRLVTEATQSPDFGVRLRQACDRVLTLRKRERFAPPVGVEWIGKAQREVDELLAM